MNQSTSAGLIAEESLDAPASERLHARARQVMPGGNTRTTVFFPPHPLYAAEGSGCRVTDVDGVERIDAVNNYTSLIHGHAHPAIIEAAMRQLGRGTCFGLPTESEVELAELLCERLPAVERLRFANSGTEAVMNTIKAARAFTGRPAIAKCEGAYHGTYDFAEISEGVGPDAWGPEEQPTSVPVSQGTPAGVLKDVIVLPLNDVAGSEAILRANAARLAGILVDAMPYRAGLVPARPEFLAMLRRVADEIGALLILDEVVSLRLGFNGAQGLMGLRPDLTALGKIIGGGFPVGAFGGRAEVMAVFDSSRGRPAVPHGGTFTANPVTMAAGLACMRLLTEAEVARLNALGDRLQTGLERVMAERGLEGQVTGLGSLRRVHPTRRPFTSYRAAYPTAEQTRLMQALHKAMLKHGVITSPTGLFALSTAMGEAEVDAIVEAFDLSVCAVARANHAG